MRHYSMVNAHWRLLLHTDYLNLITENYTLLYLKTAVLLVQNLAVLTHQVR
jgi:hypothetical protein